MARFRPSFTVKEKSWLPADYQDFDTYRELKKALPEAIKKSYDGEIHVSRSIRGEWGEWFEIWGMENGKPAIRKEGWM